MRTIGLRDLLLIGIILIVSGCGSDGATDTSDTTPATTDSKTQTEPARAASLDDVRLVQVGEFEQPVRAVAVPDTELIAVVEKTGRVRVVEGMQCSAADTCPSEPVREGRVLLDISDDVSDGNEQGLLGLAFHPSWPKDPRLFINYTDRSGMTHVTAWTLESPTATAERDEDLFTIEQPFANHNGGHLAFGPDGLLYIGTGDGGSAGDPGDRAQNPGELLGKMLRVDVDARGGGVGEPERWGIGLRNPWRYSFDAETGDLWIADVGQNAFEEINAIAAARLEDDAPVNFGWSAREGFSAFSGGDELGPGERVDPVLDYGRDDGCSITGGGVYRGELVPALTGSYLFADFCANDVRVLDAEGVPGSERTRGELAWRSFAGAEQISSFAEVQGGEVLVISLAGAIHQVVPA